MATVLSKSSRKNKPESEKTLQNTGLPLPLERFYFWEKAHPAKTCFTQPMGNGVIRTLTWAEVGREVRAMASYLQSIGLKPGGHVAILSKNCAHWIMSDLAIWMAGGVSVPLYPTLSAESVRQILQHSESKILFVGKLDDWPAMQAGVDADIQCIGYPLSPPHDFPSWDKIVQTQAPMTESPARAHGELATIIYTSGTTGMPKGVMHNFNNFAACASQISTLYEVKMKDRVISYLPLSHVAERMCIQMVQLYEGTHVFFAESLDTFAQDLVRARPTLFFSVPRLWLKFQAGVFGKIPEKRLRMLLKIPVVNNLLRKKIKQGLGLDEARYCFSGAAPISRHLLDWYKDLGIEILEVYGMTENLGYSHGTRIGHVRAGYVGVPHPMVEVKTGAGGEVLVRSPCTMTGYYKEPEKTAEALDQDGFLHTGDVGQIDSDGNLKITGRIKDIFKTSKGKYVAPAAIESRLHASEHIEQCCVMGNGLPQPVALVVLSEADRAALAAGASRANLQTGLVALVERVNDRLDPHEKLKTIIVVKGDWTIENGVMTPTLKIKRNVLESRYENRIEQWYEANGKVQWE